MQGLNLEANCTYSEPSNELIEVTDPLSLLFTNNLNILLDPGALLSDQVYSLQFSDILPISPQLMLLEYRRFPRDFSTNILKTSALPSSAFLLIAGLSYS